MEVASDVNMHRKIKLEGGWEKHQLVILDNLEVGIVRMEGENGCWDTP